MAERPASDATGDGSLVLEQRFAVVPEWVIDAEISDCAYRLYSVLLRYGLDLRLPDARPGHPRRAAAQGQ